MLTKLTIKNFKRFDNVDIELGNPVVFIGPNNSGKTTALQALAIWEVGVKRWLEKRKNRDAPERRTGVTINRRDLVTMPVPSAKLLWKGLHVKSAQREAGKLTKTEEVFMDILVEGVTSVKQWKCGLEFYYANDESFYCRPMRLSDGINPERMPIPAEAGNLHLAFLPPMSGLVANETRLDAGAINVRIGEGRTAEVLRNLCHGICEKDNAHWIELKDKIYSFFGVELSEPIYVAERGEIVMSYKEHDVTLDLSSSGRGLQQTLLLLAYMYANPNAVVLLDEPDAHLEVLRQKQIYKLLMDVALKNNNQIVIASHSEVLLNEAADRDVVVAFVGKPHRIDDRGSQTRKALIAIGFEHYYQAEQKRWVLYLEGSTDLAILQTLAETLEYNEAIEALARPFVHYVGNQPKEVSSHFHGLREAVHDLAGIAIFDRLERELPQDLDAKGLKGLAWRRREIENYLCYPDVLKAFARASSDEQYAEGPLFTSVESKRFVQAMEESIGDIDEALKVLKKGSPWDINMKVSDDFLPLLFEKYFEKLGLPNIMLKTNFHKLARFVLKEEIDSEIKEKLDAIVEVARNAKTAELP
ncbi:MAG: AAA family ATPase [Deltaproteobacteria bacterium RIFCSPLOWO2_02_FULL_53_8]|nr:MAG: AAA family ATPase [Deltaproteobacteria bacterium RIFCSPLOWO2_02_FULL_53_8]